MIWRLVIAKIASLSEIETFYNLIDVLDANDALDVDQEAQARAAKRSAKPGA